LILEPYQLVPPQRIENLPFSRPLITDDTSLGKTAEAGLILFRYDAAPPGRARWCYTAPDRNRNAGSRNCARRSASRPPLL
jgi:hypothetical protein